ncbi:MAG: DUF427 domain-containing protein [Myxococcales bacterium]|nr:DUF427 domain-containing protein [Myxococcales bacterium]MCB9714111.1 DUF427 domain-containing protein [Myxococcales bacterium]
MAIPTDAVRRARARWSEPSHPRPPAVQTPGPGQESVWSYPRPPRLEPCPHPISVEFAGETIARSTRALRLLETSHPPTYYLPPSDVAWSFLERAPGASMCEWKGAAAYWSVRVGSRVAERSAWSYPDPFEEFAPLRDHLAFYCEAMDACFVGDQRARPQPGGFYGGWITDHVVGPFKGEPGSQGW